MNKQLTTTTKTILAVVFFLLVLLIIVVPKGALVAWCNSTYTENTVLIFRVFNIFGDAIIFAFLFPVFLFHKYNRAIYFALLLLVQTLIVQFFKSGIADGAHRPMKYFQDLGIQLQTGAGVKMHYYDSFPSGHATTAFTLGIFLMMLNRRNTTYQLIVFCIACIAAFSRVYLAQHFFIDISAGYFCSLLTFHIVDWLNMKFGIYKIKGNLRITLSQKWQLPWSAPQKYHEPQQYF